MPQPLLDHHELRDESRWQGFHNNWAVKIVDYLNAGVLPAEYRSDSEVRAGVQAVIDVAGLRDAHEGNGHAPSAAAGGTAVATYAPPRPTLAAAVDFADTDVYEVKVRLGRWDVVAAVELVSPANKDRPQSRRLFAGKVGGYLAAGLSVVVVDVNGERSADPHADLCDALGLPPALRWESPSGLSAVAYRPVQGVLPGRFPAPDGRVRLEVWPHELRVGESLPTVPLWLAADLAVPLDLDATYAAACRSLRLA
jgi:hypothetical protein